MNRTKKVVLSSMLVAIAVLGSFFHIPVGLIKVSPVQHVVNLLAGVILGPAYATIVAFVASLIRLLTGERVIIVIGAVCVIKSRVAGTLNKYISCIA